MGPVIDALSTSTERGAVPLAEPLPDEVGGGWLRGIVRYQRWPVFSLRWMAGRSLVFGAVIAGLAVLTLLGSMLGGIGWRAGVSASATMLLSLMLMAFAGPLLATAVRYRGWPLRRERIAVVLAIIVGIGLALLADHWGSSRIAADLEPVAGAAKVAATVPPPAPWMKAAGAAIAFGIYFTLGGGLALSGYFREQRQWAEARQRRDMMAMQQARREAEQLLAVLQAQVEPHFLFNTLASIRALVAVDASRAERTLDALAAHLRATMPAVGADAILPPSTLDAQLAIAGSYLEVMRLRLGDRLAVAIDADAATRAQPFPPLLLITLVENAVKHGIEPKRGHGEIRIEARRDDGRLRVDVLDDGVGLQPGQGGGVGLANVRAQLAASFGSSAALTVGSRPGGGCAVRIDLPWRGDDA